MDTKREVVIVTTVTITTRTSTSRWHYKGMSETQILEYEKGQEINNVLEDFVRDVESTSVGQLILERTVRIEDKK